MTKIEKDDKPYRHPKYLEDEDRLNAGYQREPTGFIGWLVNIFVFLFVLFMLVRCAVS